MKSDYKKLIGIFSAFLVILISYALYNNLNSINEACFRDKVCFNVETADSRDEIIKGLSERQSLEDKAGMIFIFQKETIPDFWMNGMHFPIDIIWINKEKIVTEIERDLKPCLMQGCLIFSPDQSIKYVLEINSNSSLKYNISEGDTVDLLN